MFLMLMTLAAVPSAAESPYDLSREQSDALVHSLQRPASEGELESVYEQLRFFRPEHAATLFRNEAFVRDCDEAVQAVHGRQATIEELMEAARFPKVVASKRRLQEDVRNRDENRLAPATLAFLDEKERPIARALMIDSPLGTMFRTDANGFAKLGGRRIALGSFIHELSDGGYRVLIDDDVKEKPDRAADQVVKRRLGPAVSGTIRDKEGRPIRGALVGVDYSPPRWPPTAFGMTLHATSDEHGRYSVKWLYPGSSRLQFSFRHPNFVRTGEFREERIGDVVADVDVALQRGCAVKGTVTDEGGKSVAAAEVRVGRPWNTSFVTYTDDRGQFELGNVKPGSEFLVVERRGFVRGWRRVPFAVDQPQTVDFVMKKGAFIRGAVLDSKGKPAPRLVVDHASPKKFLGFADNEEVPASKATDATDERGEFELGPFAEGETMEFEVRGKRSHYKFGGKAGGQRVVCKLTE